MVVTLVELRVLLLTNVVSALSVSRFGAIPIGRTLLILPTAYPTQDAGPNGNIEFLNCGVRGGGWNPPRITLDNVICKPFSEVVNMPGNPFGGCSAYSQIFIDAGRDTGIPSTLLAAIAMQESSCQPWVTGRAGEVGMMQVTGEKCPNGYAGPECYEPYTNVYIGARYLKGEIDRAGGNLLLAMGFYNGWYVGLTIDAANNKPSCGQRNNLDYLQFVFNGYCQGVDPSSVGMGTFRNVC
ncbi:hypothetical protein FRC14_003178 [Serendipita sp. 396]|nr:hypothetical protein FRC14_003178 [Serendipita sp. 396]